MENLLAPSRLEFFHLILQTVPVSVLPLGRHAGIAVNYVFLRYLDRYLSRSGSITIKEDGRPIGYIGVSPSDAHDLGYGLGRAHWGKGIAAEAGRAVLERCRRAGYPFVTATHDVHNPRSGGVMKQLGMQYRYSYEEQWQPKDILVTFRMYQLNFDGEQERIYKKYWDNSAVHFIEEGL